MSQSAKKPRVAVLYGGVSAEHDVSVMSATNVMAALPRQRFELTPVFVTRDGRWLLGGFEDGQAATPEAGTQVSLVPGGRGRMVGIDEAGTMRQLPTIDVLFPVLHGLGGEDGSVQGVAQAALVPMAGCGILGSAAALDKGIAKALFMQAGIPVAASATIRHGQVPSFEELSDRLGLPLFVKPARQGSSVGVSKVTSTTEYRVAIDLGFRHDDTLLAEEFIDGREIECAVLERPDGSLFVSRPGEIVTAASHGFYTYEAKYIDGDGAAVIVPTDLPAEIEASLRDLAARAFRALGCDGMARADFFLTENGRVLVNELNTIPGFTDISMYPKAMEASGVPYPDLIEKLIDHGIARFRAKGR